MGDNFICTTLKLNLPNKSLLHNAAHDAVECNYDSVTINCFGKAKNKVFKTSFLALKECFNTLNCAIKILNKMRNYYSVRPSARVYRISLSSVLDPDSDWS